MSPSTSPRGLHLFTAILTYAAPSTNHHGKGDSDKPLQTIPSRSSFDRAQKPSAIFWQEGYHSKQFPIGSCLKKATEPQPIDPPHTYLFAESLR